MDKKDDGMPLGALTIGEFRELMEDMLAGLLGEQDAFLANLVKASDGKREETRLVPRMEVSRMLGVSSATLWRWDRAGYLKPVRLGVKVMYRMSDLEVILGRRGDGKERQA